MNSVEAQLNYLNNDFNLSVDIKMTDSDRLILYGPSGSGKTTILKLLLGLLQPNQGKISISGQVILDTQTETYIPAHKRKIGYVPQDYRLFPHLSVINNITYGMPKHLTGSHKKFLNLITDTLSISDLADRNVTNLSGGEMQRVAIGRALSIRPNLLLLDEPSTSLDSELSISVRTLIKRIHEEFKIPTIIVTHDQQEALALGTQLHVLHNGQFIESGEPSIILGQPQKLQTAALIDIENIFSATVTERDSTNGITVCQYHSLNVEIPLYDTQIGDSIQVGIKASDIIVATKRPTHISARNIFEVEVIHIDQDHSGIMLKCKSGLSEFSAKITKSALDDLDISQGQNAYILFKASSCFMLKP